jgi:hypothetical protein
MKRVLLSVVALAAAFLLSVPAAGAAEPRLRAGAGQADITPPKTGYYLGGWTRGDRLALGQSTRLYANTLVLQRGSTKVALVAAEIFAIPGGLQEDVARSVADLGLGIETVLLAASHTHSGPGGYANNPTYNTAAPSVDTVMDPSSFVALLDPLPADRQLYTFLVQQIAASIRRADRDMAPAVAAWGRTELYGLTENRSIEAHLANHGMSVPFGQGAAAMDPEGEAHTIDPIVDVLRVDKVVKRRGRRARRVPIGAFSSFADHGTVVKSETQLYSGDHHAAAWRVFADRVRKAAKVPRRQTVVNVYPNGAEGDITAGLRYDGVQGAIEVGTKEAQAMFRAWRQARRRLTARPELGVRWTRACFCGRDTATGRVDSEGRAGLAFLTGSEEGRGPLYDQTGVPFEGVKNPIEDPVQGNKVVVPAGSFPPSVPLAIVRVGDGALATIPGEPSKEVGVRVRAAVLDAMRPGGVGHVVIAGLANDFIQYVTTPEEYGEQSYEGSTTLYGKHQATFMQERLAELGKALVTGAPAPEPHPFDASYGVKPGAPAYPQGAASATVTEQPRARVARSMPVDLAWNGGADGADRPVDRAFVTAQRRVKRRWRNVDSDLGLNMVWRVDGEGRYALTWSIPPTAPKGRYRLRVTASRYELVSRTFRVA